MLYQAKNKAVQIGNTVMTYAEFGTGEKNLIMIPGLGDGLRTDRKLAYMYAILYGKFAKDYKVYVFSQKTIMPDRYSTGKMARDVKEAMDALGIAKADVIGVSLGGMIAQHLAADYPEVVRKLVLVVTSARRNQYIQACISSWIEMAKRGDYRRLMVDNLKKMYTKEYLEKNKWLTAVAGKIGKHTLLIDRRHARIGFCNHRNLRNSLHGTYHRFQLIRADRTVQSYCRCAKLLQSFYHFNCRSAIQCTTVCL